MQSIAEMVDRAVERALKKANTCDLCTELQGELEAVVSERDRTRKNIAKNALDFLNLLKEHRLVEKERDNANETIRGLKLLNKQFNEDAEVDTDLIATLRKSLVEANREIDSLKPKPGSVIIVCNRCKGRGCVPWGCWGRVKVCPDCNGATSGLIT